MFLAYFAVSPQSAIALQFVAGAPYAVTTVQELLVTGGKDWFVKWDYEAFHRTSLFDGNILLISSISALLVAVAEAQVSSVSISSQL